MKQFGYNQTDRQTDRLSLPVFTHANIGVLLRHIMAADYCGDGLPFFDAFFLEGGILETKGPLSF